MKKNLLLGLLALVVLMAFSACDFFAVPEPEPVPPTLYGSWYEDGEFNNQVWVFNDNGTYENQIYANADTTQTTQTGGNRGDLTVTGEGDSGNFTVYFDESYTALGGWEESDGSSLSFAWTVDGNTLTFGTGDQARTMTLMDL